MKKPKKKTIICYDYSDCTRYIEEKYKIDTRNVLKHSHAMPEPENNPPYCDFWHFLVENCQPTRNGLFTVYEELGWDAEPWVKQVLKYYLDEFGEYDRDAESNMILFHSDW